MVQTDIRKDRLLNLWQFEWPILDVLIGGKSSVDLQKLSIKDVTEANQFLKTYGYDSSRIDDQKKISAIFIEAINFIAEHLIPKEWKQGLKPPADLLNSFDVNQLLVYASEPTSSHHQAWSCAILRVMHTIAHIDDMERLRILEAAKDQIISRFQAACFRDEQGKLWFGNEKSNLEISKVEWKTTKSRKSMILKLLHKPANVSETIYDLIGVRIITKSVSDALLVVKQLRALDLVPFPNINPARIRNNLIRLEEFRAQIETLSQLFQQNLISQKQFVDMIQDIGSAKPIAKLINPHSSQRFRSIQMTCRQRIIYSDPSSLWKEHLEKLCVSLSHNHPAGKILGEVLADLDKFYQDYGCQMEHSIFFPFEVQIIDSQTAKEMEAGDASHDRYKKAQLRTARRRILTRVLKLPKFHNRKSESSYP